MKNIGCIGITTYWGGMKNELFVLCKDEILWLEGILPTMHDGERRMNPRRGKPVSISPCVLCEVTIIDVDQWGVWCPQCHRALKLNWS